MILIDPNARPTDTTITDDMVPPDVQRRWADKVRAAHERQQRQVPGHGPDCYCDACDWQGSEE